MRLAALSGLFALIILGPVRTETAAAASRKYSCESCSADGVKATAAAALALSANQGDAGSGKDRRIYRCKTRHAPQVRSTRPLPPVFSGADDSGLAA